MGDEIALLTIAEAGRRMDEGELDSSALVEACVARIQAHDHAVASFLTLDGDGARAAAKSAAARIAKQGRKGPLDGIPLAVKDVFDTADMPTTGNSRILADNRPASDAAAIAHLRGAGAILLGKLAAWEFAMGGTSTALPWPPTRNPWDLARDPGGSSTGSAAAVAAGFVFGSLGTDTGGSIREPAAWCGLAGLKPTQGLVPLEDTLAASLGFDHAGPMARSSEDCALLLDAMVGNREPRFAGVIGSGVAGMRVGVIDLGSHADGLHPDVVTAMWAARRTFEAARAIVNDVRLPPLDLFSAVVTVMASVEGYVLHRDRLPAEADRYDPLTLQRILAGADIPGSAYVEAMAVRSALRREVAAAFRSFDLFLMPTTYGPAPLLGGFDSHGGHASLGRPWNVVGAPALSIRAGFDRDGMPLGLQLVGAPGSDGPVLAAGHALEQGLGSTGQWPDLAKTATGRLPVPTIDQPDPAALDAATKAAIERIRAAASSALRDLLMMVGRPSPVSPARGATWRSRRRRSGACGRAGARRRGRASGRGRHP